MSNANKNHKPTHYRVVTTVENDGEKAVLMYGVEAFSGEETITMTALSDDCDRIKRLVVMLNESELELCHFHEVIQNFMYENYGLRLFE